MHWNGSGVCYAGAGLTLGFIEIAPGCTGSMLGGYWDALGCTWMEMVWLEWYWNGTGMAAGVH